MMFYLELIAVALGIANVGLLIRRSIWNYPFGIVMVSIYGVIFYDAKLYSEAALQVFFLLIQIFGWLRWREAQKEAGTIEVRWSSPVIAALWALGTAVLAFAIGSAMDRYTDAAAPYPDAFIAAASIAAQCLLVQRRVENWIYWIVIDILAIWLFYTRELTATSGLYAVFLVMATIGLWQWIKSYQSQTTQNVQTAQTSGAA